MGDLQLEYERVHAAAIITEKRGRNFDKVIGEWKAKVDDLAAEIEASQKECRNYNSELFRLKAAWDETAEQLDVVKREDVLSMSLTNKDVVLRLRRKSSRLHLKKL